MIKLFFYASVMVFEEILRRISKGIDVCFACQNDDPFLKNITIHFIYFNSSQKQLIINVNNNMFLPRIEIYKIDSYIIKFIFTVYVHHFYHF